MSDTLTIYLRPEDAEHLSHPDTFAEVFSSPDGTRLVAFAAIPLSSSGEPAPEVVDVMANRIAEAFEQEDCYNALAEFPLHETYQAFARAAFAALLEGRK